MPLSFCENYLPDIHPDWGRSKTRAPNLSGSEQMMTGLVREVVCSVFFLSQSELTSKNRGKAHIAFARQVAMYLANISLGLTFTEIGTDFGRDRTTVAHACQLIEDKREDPDFDWSLDLMERSLLLLIATQEAKGLRDA
tara:strand:- start:2 stop:418 length:417 start_codon:yes stop_codon:yes gene_type:complete